MNDKLTEVVNFYLGNQVMARITDDNLLPKATSSIADACLEVTDATCLVMATMRYIIKQHRADDDLHIRDTKIRRLDEKNTPQQVEDSKSSTTSASAPISIPQKEIMVILSYIELALFVSQNDKNAQVECLLDQVISLVKNIVDRSKSSPRGDD